MVVHELKRLHEDLSTKFDPDSNEKALQTLHTIWRVLLAPEPFVRSSELWKTVGFQGKDPVTDVRGGGLLAMECLATFATRHTQGLKATGRPSKGRDGIVASSDGRQVVQRSKQPCFQASSAHGRAASTDSGQK